MYQQLIEQKKPDFERCLSHLQAELNTIRTGRASPALVENLMVESYDTKTPLKNLASITVPEPRSLVIQPWDKAILADVEKALIAANLGLQPINDGLRVRLNLPPLNEERRKELVKTVKRQGEATRVRIRNIREDLWREAGRLMKEKKLTEDQKYEVQEQLNRLVEEYNGKIKSMLEKKEEEIMTV